jgi:hypothetical protein
MDKTRNYLINSIMKAREFIPEYEVYIDPDELHKAAYLQRKVDQYNARYQNRKPLSGAAPVDDEKPQSSPNPLGTFAKSFGQELIDPEYSTPTPLTRGIRKAKSLMQRAQAYSDSVSTPPK